jgi:hypothetical protein
VTKTHTDTKAQDEVSGNHQIAVQSPERKANGSGVRAHHKAVGEPAGARVVSRDHTPYSKL